jgi:hypothetical protein
MALHSLPGCFQSVPIYQTGKAGGRTFPLLVSHPSTLSTSHTPHHVALDSSDVLIPELGLGSDCSTPAGCVVQDASPVSFGAPFAAAGGGVYAVQLDVEGLLCVCMCYRTVHRLHVLTQLLYSMWFWTVRLLLPRLTSQYMELTFYLWTEICNSSGTNCGCAGNRSIEY